MMYDDDETALLWVLVLKHPQGTASSSLGYY